MREADDSDRTFPSTHWSAIRSAALELRQGDRPTLSELLRRYVPALRAHLLIRRSAPRDQIDDLVQGFISSKVLESDLLGRADRSKGKFRSLLLTALDRYVVSQQRHDAAAKRGARNTRELSPEIESGAVAGSRADTFDVAWARQVLRETLVRAREQCEASGRPDVWHVFQCRILRPTLEGVQPTSYAQVVQQFGYRSPSQMWNAVRTGKTIFARQLRAIVAEYAESDEQIETEIRDLCEICGQLPQDDGSVAYPSSV